MSTVYNPKIPTDGLLMIIDPRNSNCWDGSSVKDPLNG